MERGGGKGREERGEEGCRRKDRKRRRNEEQIGRECSDRKRGGEEGGKGTGRAKVLFSMLDHCDPSLVECRPLL